MNDFLNFKTPQGFNGPANLLSALFFVGGFAALRFAGDSQPGLYWLAGALLIVAVLTPFALKMANQWERAVVLRLGKLNSIAGPGMFLIIPVGRATEDLRLDVWGMAWDAPGLYRPQYQTRAELRLQTNWLSRFPSGNFGFTFAVVDEYRSRTAFSLPDEPAGTAPGTLEHRTGRGFGS